MMLGMLCTTGLLKKTSCKCMPALSLLTGDQGGRKRTHETCGRWPWKFAKAQNQRSSTIARTSGNRPNSTRLYDDLIKACGPECLSKQMKTLDHTYKHVETSHEHHPEEPVLHCEPKQQYQSHHRHITRIHVCQNSRVRTLDTTSFIPNNVPRNIVDVTVVTQAELACSSPRQNEKGDTVIEKTFKPF